MKFSVIVPAHNEERFLPQCLNAIERAARSHNAEIEIIVVLNRCTDGTGRIAEEHGAKTIIEDRRNLAAIRNAGVRGANHDVIVTVDADSVVSENLFAEIERALESGRYVGGGVKVIPERRSLGIALTHALLWLVLFFTGLGGGVYWCRKEDFWAVDGFNEEMPFGEDLDFAKRLKAHGKKTGRRFTTLRKASIVTSCRKLDTFGDWLFFRIMFLEWRSWKRALSGESTELQDRYFYDFNNE